MLISPKDAIFRKTCLKIILLMGRYRILEECFFSQMFMDVKHTKKLHKVPDRFSTGS